MPRRAHIYKPALSQGFGSVEKWDPQCGAKMKAAQALIVKTHNGWAHRQCTARGTRGPLMLASKKALILNEETEQTELQGQGSDN